MREPQEQEVRSQPAEAQADDAQHNVTRRALIIGGASTAVLLGLGSLRLVGQTPLVRPPGGQDVETLLSRCIHCNRCGQACPQNLLVPQNMELGIMGTRTPYMVFSDNTPGYVEQLKYCDMCVDANDGIPLCVEACPSSALVLPSDYAPETYVVGFAEIDKNQCMAYRSGVCVFCHDACIEARGEEHAAIYFEGGASTKNQIPKVDVSKCNGCGACESVCISAQAGSTRNREVRAIVVKPIELLEQEQEEGEAT